MKRPSDLKSDIEKIKKLKALQAKATDKLNKITQKAAGKTPAAKPPKKKTAKPPVKKKAAVKNKAALKNKAQTPAKKTSFWKKLFGKKSKKTARKR